MTENTGREFPQRPLVGIGAVIVGHKGVVLIKRGKAPRLGSWSLPGGAQKIGETVHAAALREIQEETGLTAEIRGLVDVVDSITPDPDGRIKYHYTLVDLWATTDAVAEPIAGGDAADAQWFSLADLEGLQLWSETLRVIDKAHTLWQESHS
ncbi:NUDIX hydrolase [Thalassospiraceae bacterium LMO-JJ14]|nr:NUDIX hydrolase [Thalassospiraceae bacterium LMO-JJ14]